MSKYILIIRAYHLGIEIISLGYFDQIGTKPLNGGALNVSPFLSAIHNALTYLMSTGKTVVVKCQPGSSIAEGCFKGRWWEQGR